MTRIFLPLLKAAAVAVAMTGAAAAQDYPNKPVKIVAPFAPGGINDLAARVLATHLSEKLGKQFIVENRTGGGGAVGSESVAKAPPDGYTLLIVSIANAVQPAIYKLNFDPHTAFAPISLFVTSPNMLAVHPDLPAKTLKEFIDLVKAKPDEIHYASGGIGGSLHVGMEYFRMITHTKMVHVPFRGAGPGTTDVVAGNTKAVMSTVSSVFGHVAGGKLRGLAVASPKRLPALPDVPTFIEAGLPEYEGGNWIGLAAPAGTPQPIIDLLHKEIVAIQDKPDVQKQFENRGAEVVKMDPKQLKAFMESEIAKWARVAKEADIKAQ